MDLLDGRLCGGAPMGSAMAFNPENTPASLASPFCSQASTERSFTVQRVVGVIASIQGEDVLAIEVSVDT